MASKEQIQKFINTIGTLARAEAKRRSKWVLPSICIAQAAIETGWGTSKLMSKANAFFGIKWTRGCGYDAYSSKTNEVYNGSTCTITAAFRAYDSLADSVKDYYDLLTGLSYYRDMVNNPDYKTAVWGIDNNGDDNAKDGIFMYATDPDYQSKIVNIIESYNLTVWDSVTGSGTSGTGSEDMAAGKYYQAYKGSLPLAAALDTLGIDSSFAFRKKIAQANGISGYCGTYDQNINMLNLLKTGQLRRV